MRGHRDYQGYVSYVGDDLEDVKAQTEELTLSIRRFLVRRRPWYIRAKWQWDVQVRSIQFFDPLKPTGVVGKFQNFWTIIFGVSKWFVGGVPILAAMFIAAGLNNWDFLSQSTVSLTAAGIGYFAFWVLWCIIDMARLAGKVRFNDK